ncbi:MFS transporter small subunit [Burkholderia sp. 22313]|nr:oxalate:formate antiporter [Burkholderia sp.]
MNEMVASVRPTNKAVLAVFWLYVLVPLAWGVVNTLATAMKLFG